MHAAGGRPAQRLAGIPNRSSCCAGSTSAALKRFPRDRIAAVYQPYLGKKVSQADLAAIAGAISDLYRSQTAST